MSPLKTKKFSILHLVVVCVIAITITFYLTDIWVSKKADQQLGSVHPGMCKIDIKRLNGLKYIKPLMFADEECESDDLSGLKQRISDIINRYKANQDVTNASFFLKKTDNNDWTGLNEDELYQPGSLFKVPVLITILKMNEMHPGFLNKSVIYDQKYEVDKKAAYATKSIQFGHSYTIRELLDYMIKYSDNYATILLEKNMDVAVFTKLFDDMGLKTPSENDPNYFISVKQYSYFMRAIYNAAYLTIEDSELAAEILTHCDFKDGIMKGLPAGTLVAHKFGESGDQNSKQLHESAIVYLNGNPYLLTIMTKGTDNQKLSQLITEISQAVYLEMNSGTSTI